jgi:hypothetical protein
MQRKILSQIEYVPYQQLFDIKVNAKGCPDDRLYQTGLAPL